MLDRLRAGFREQATSQVERLLDVRAFDAVAELTEGYPLKVFGDAVGLAAGDRDTIDPEALGAIMYAAADAGDITEQEAGMLVRSFLSAGVDTTVRALGGALLCFAENPVQWETLRENPSLARNATEEAIRHASPFQTVFRTTSREIDIGPVALSSDEKLLLSLGAANRDPEKWDDPDSFDVNRKAGGHVGFGAGIHGCAGQMLARLEIEVLLGEMATRVARIELNGEIAWALNNTTRGLGRLPVILHAA